MIVQADLPELIDHLEQAAIFLLKGGRGRIRLWMALWQLYGTMKRNCKKPDRQTQRSQHRQWCVGYRLARNRQHCCSVCRKLSGKFGHAWQISNHLGRTFRLHWHAPKFHRIYCTGRTHYQLCLVLGWTERILIQEGENRQYAQHELCRVHRVRTGLLDQVCPKEGLLATICINYRKLNEMTVKDTYPIPGMDECLDSLCKVSIFSTVDTDSGYCKTAIDDWDKNTTKFKSHQGLQISTNAGRSAERAKHFPPRDRHYTVNLQGTFCACIPRRRLHLLRVSWRTPGPPIDCTKTTFEGRRICEKEWTILLRGPYWQIGSHYSALKTWFINESEQCYPWTTKTYQCHWNQFASGRSQPISVVCTKFCMHGSTIQLQAEKRPSFPLWTTEKMK